MLRVKPLAGRFFDASSNRRGGVPEVVLGHQLWLRRFGGDSAIVGRAVRVNGQPMVVGGIAPEGFVGAMRLLAADMWRAFRLYRAARESVAVRCGSDNRVRRRWTAGPRRRSNSSRARLDVVLAHRANTANGVRPATSVVVAASGFGVPPVVRGAVLSGSFLLGGLMALIVGVTIANVVSLVLARVAGRRRELGVRFALGAKLVAGVPADGVRKRDAVGRRRRRRLPDRLLGDALARGTVRKAA